MFFDPLLMEAEDMKWRLFREEGQIYENQERPIVSNHQNEEQQRKEDVSEDEEREHMFEKPLTPSDVGKLNRLVIPKQHAEKFFPLDSTNNEKDLLLSFEDSMGKDWRFRYSYWNSSQSYVLTKGWSRFVKEKKLDAGDVVSFERRVSGKRLYISWKRRQISEVPPTPALWNRFWYSCNPNPSDSIFYLRPPSADIYPGEPIGGPITPTRSKRLRLFGVNLDCSTEPSEPGRSNGRVQSGSELRPTEGSSSSSSPTDFDHLRVWIMLLMKKFLSSIRDNPRLSNDSSKSHQAANAETLIKKNSGPSSSEPNYMT